MIKKGMSFNVNLGFAGLTDPEARHSADKTYAIFIGDTVLAGDEVSFGRGRRVALRLKAEPFHDMLRLNYPSGEYHMIFKYWRD